MKANSGKSFVPYAAMLLVIGGFVSYSSCDSGGEAKKSAAKEAPVDNKEGETDSTDADNTTTDGTDDTVKEPVVLDGVYVATVTLPESKSYKVGETLSFQLKFSEAVEVTGAPRVKFLVGPTTSTQTKEVFAVYESGSGSDTLVFKYSLVAGDFSPFGMKLAQTADGPVIDLSGGAITAGGKAANLSLENFPSASGLKLAEGLKVTDGFMEFHGGTVAASCTGYRTDKHYIDEGTGKYWIQDPSNPTGKIKAFCDMTAEPNYGWMLVMNYVHASGDTTAIDESDTILPIAQPNQAIGDNQASNTEAWGNASLTLIKSFSPTYIRWNCQASDTNKKIHFRTQEALCAAGNAGSGGQAATCTNNTLLTQFTSQTGHDASFALPTGGIVNDTTKTGDASILSRSITTNPFANELGAAPFKAGWQVGGSNWDCERGAVNATTDTIHQMWIR